MKINKCRVGGILDEALHAADTTPPSATLPPPLTQGRFNGYGLPCVKGAVCDSRLRDCLFSATPPAALLPPPPSQGRLDTKVPLVYGMFLEENCVSPICTARPGKTALENKFFPIYIHRKNLNLLGRQSTCLQHHYICGIWQLPVL